MSFHTTPTFMSPAAGVNTALASALVVLHDTIHHAALKSPAQHAARQHL